MIIKRLFTMIEIAKLKKLLIEKNLQIHGLKPKKQLHYLKKLQQLQKIIILKLLLIIKSISKLYLQIDMENKQLVKIKN